MSPLSRLARSALGRVLASTAARQRTLVALVAVPLAIAFVAGTALGWGAERGGWGGVAILASIPVALFVGALAGWTLLRGVQSVRRVHRAVWLEEKVEPLRLDVRDGAPRRVNLLLPTIELKHLFGGYITKFNLARKLAEQGLRARIVTVDPTPTLPRSWRQEVESYAGLQGMFDTVEVAFGRDHDAPLEVSPNDAFIATTWWTAHIANAALRSVKGSRFLYLIQEYEPFTFPMGSAASLARGSYELPHTALFSTELLREWFALHGIGVFAEGRAAGERDSVSFENAITPVGPVSARELRRPGPGRLLFYARPEEHATRNLFEVGAMALDEAIASGHLEGWELAGVGAVELRASTLPLRRSGASLTLIPRSAQADYASLLRSFDIGLALMYTPHPSLVPIEMSAAGMSTVTNTFENKDAAALGRISSNLIAAEPSVQGVAAALAEAEARSNRLGDRAAGSRVEWPKSWDEALDAGVLAEIERLLVVEA
jgi:hypothetical protein